MTVVPACVTLDDCDVTPPTFVPTKTATFFSDPFAAFVEEHGDDEEEDDAEPIPVILLFVEELDNTGDEMILVMSSTFGRVAFVTFETLVGDVTVNEDDIES